MKSDMERECVGIMLAEIYQSEINARLEWFWDGGYNWCLLTPMGNDYAQPECVATGNEDTIEGAVSRLSDAILDHFPQSVYAAMWRSYTHC